MILIDAVNRVMQKIGENRVKSVNSTNVSLMCAQAVADSYAAFISEAPWSFCERIVTPSVWNADHAVLDEGVVDIKYVYYDNRSLRYLSTAELLQRMSSSGYPCFWSLLGRQLLFTPFPEIPEQQLKIKLLVQYYDVVDPADDTHVIEIPRELDYILILRACMQMSIDHLSDPNKTNGFSGEYTRLLTQAKPRFLTSYRNNSAIA